VTYPSPPALETEPVIAVPVVAAEGEPAAVAASAGTDLIYERLWESGLLNVLAIARRELTSLFVTPAAYAVGAVVIIATSLFGYLQQVNAGTPVSMAAVFNWVAVMMVFFAPLYTMRLLAEEKRSGTLEQLLTSPVRFWELVLGKWLGGLVFYLATIAFTLVYVVLISVYQQLHGPASFLGLNFTIPNVDYGSIFTGYVGLVLVAAAWVALGLLASSLTQNQIIAAITGVVILLAFEYGFGIAAGMLSQPFSDFFDYMSAGNRAQSFNQGQIVLRDLLYFVTLTAGALFLTTRVVESRKWR
jgi:ABC-2 type transport system permease protein